MTVSPQYSGLNAEANIVGKEQERTTTEMLWLFIFALAVTPIIFSLGMLAVGDFAWIAILLVFVCCWGLGLLLLFTRGAKDYSCWIEGGYYVDYRHKDKNTTIRIYYKDIVCWSATLPTLGQRYKGSPQDLDRLTKTTVFDKYGQHVIVDDTLAFPHLFRYLIENNVPVHMNSPVKTVGFLQERYKKAYEQALKVLEWDLKK